MNALTGCERQRLDDDGFLAMEKIVQPNRVTAMSRRLDELLVVAEQKHRGTIVLQALLEDEVFDDSWLQPRVLAAAGHVLGEGFRLTGVALRGILAGHGQQAMHIDWSDGLGGEPGVWYGCHAICALVDFTKENGATLRPRVASKPLDAKDQARPAKAAPGTVPAHWRGRSYSRSEHPLRTLCSP
jgi:hypothetical protein